MLRFVNQDLSVLPDFMRSDWVVPGVGDAGAHVSMIMDAGWSSFFLSYWHRDQQEFSLEQSINYLTAKQARIIGLQIEALLRWVNVLISISSTSINWPNANR